MYHNNTTTSQCGSLFRGVWEIQMYAALPLSAFLPIERLNLRDPQKQDFVKTFTEEGFCEDIKWQKTKDTQ